MRIDIAGWQSIGLRCPDVSVELIRENQVPQISLIQMPNGTGKTTTLELLNATLSGSAEHWDAEEVINYRRKQDNRTHGQFKVTLLVDGSPLSVELILNFETGKASYKSTSPGSGGVVQRWSVPPSVNRFLRPEFLSLFIFDGEFAGKMLDDGLAEADRVVDALCQVYLLDEIAAFADSYWERSAKKVSTRTHSGLKKLRRSRDRLVKRKKSVEAALTAARTEAARLTAEIKELTQKINVRLGTVKATRESHQKAELERQRAIGQVTEKSLRLLQDLRLPQSLHPKLADQLKELRDNLDKLKLPENTSSQFFRELVGETECICGRPMDAKAIGRIEERASRYLDEDYAGVMNLMKAEIEEFAVLQEHSSVDVGFARVERLSGELNAAVRKRKLAEQQVRTLRLQLIKAGDAELENWQETLEAKEEKLDEIKELIDSIEGLGDSEIDLDQPMSLKLIERLLKEKNKQISKITKTVQLRKQTQFIQNLLDEAALRARQKIRKELLRECNRRLETILVNDPLKIEDIDRSIRLFEQQGASTGQTLSIGYTFLMSVLARGKNDFPLIVDSPAGPIDEGVRRRIGNLLPKLCTQFIGFTINTERAGFVESLERQAKEVVFLTLFRKTPGTQHMMASLPEGRFTETENAVLVTDRDYFFRFDIRDEDENNNVI